MRDRYTLHLKNFRSIRDAEIDIAPLTVIYGQNGTGKSSLMYGLLTLRNFLTEPERSVAGLFSYPTISLGGLDEVVTGHNIDEETALSLAVSTTDISSKFTLGISQPLGKSTIDLVMGSGTSNGFSIALDIPFPYYGNMSTTDRSEYQFYEPDLSEIAMNNFIYTWNGISLGIATDDPEIAYRMMKRVEIANSPMELAKSTGFVPIKRGFMTPNYSISSVTPTLPTEVEVASLLATERFTQYEVSGYMEMIADRRVNTHAMPGEPTFTIDSIPRNKDVTVSLVNEGFGINQLVYMLTVCLHDKTKIVAIEEPEIHLHPSMVRKLVHAMVDIVTNHDKRIIVSTHSQDFVLSLLAEVAREKIGVNDVSFILAEKEGGESKFTKNEAYPNGQLDGGITPFVEAGFEDIRTFLGLEEEAV